MDIAVQNISDYIFQLNSFLWGGPILLMLVSIGVYQTISLRGIQFKYLGHAMGLVLNAKSDSKASGDISSFQALMTSLAGAIGTGNIAGIAAAITIGGFGSLFWMWVISLFGMATAYSESLLSIKYRVTNKLGQMSGGPMYTLERGLKSKKLGILFALLATAASFGIGGMVQSNSVVDAMCNVYPSFSKPILGFIITAVTASVILGGISSIGTVAGALVPFMAAGYLFFGLLVIAVNYQNILPAFNLIITSAFTGQAAVGGFVGSSVLLAMQYGVSNGVFANEAGLGSLSIAASSAQVDKPATQGMYAITGVFLSSMVVCTITGLVLAVSNVLGMQDIDGNLITGSALAMEAFATGGQPLKYVVLVSLILFAFTTMLAWSYYGEKCLEYLLGEKSAIYYRIAYLACVMFGAVLRLDLVWAISNLMNAMMIIPNLISIFMLSDVVKEQTREYISNISKDYSFARLQS